jgi:hypothetical protein
VHENRAAAEMVQRADEEKLGANAEFAQGRLELAVQGWATAIQMLVAAERDHGDHFGAALEVRARFQSSSGVLHCGLVRYIGRVRWVGRQPRRVACGVAGVQDVDHEGLPAQPGCRIPPHGPASQLPTCGGGVQRGVGPSNNPR